MTDKESRTMDIGQKILEIRKAEGLSQTEFAEKFHVTRQTVSNWEHGKNYPDMETLMRISDEYGMLRYEADNPEFMKMVDGDTSGIDGEFIREWTEAKIHYVEKNGLKVYGFAVDATKEMLLNIVDSGKVCNIKTQENS